MADVGQHLIVGCARRPILESFRAHALDYGHWITLPSRAAPFDPLMSWVGSGAGSLLVAGSRETVDCGFGVDDLADVNCMPRARSGVGSGVGSD
jgi:hypothetical protein